MMSAVADHALLAGYGAGDPEAAMSFVRRHQGRVFGVAVAIVVDRALAEDIAQEAFTRAWRYAGTYDPLRGSVVAWLLTITRNLAIDALRLKRALPIDPATLAGLEMVATGAGVEPASAAEAAEDGARVRAALATLPEEQRRALVLAGLCGRTAKEVSEREGIPLGTAKTRIRAGMRRLNAALTVAPSTSWSDER